MKDINDLIPKDHEIDVDGVRLTVKPLRLSQVLELSKIGDVMENPRNYKRQEMREAEDSLAEVIGELIPELAGKQLSISVLMQLLNELLLTIQPSDNQELADRGVKFDSDPKAGEAG